MTRRFPRTRIAMAVALIGVGLAAAQPAAAQAGLRAYPNAGQNQDQQAKDRFQCHEWAVQQSGFDPTTADPVAQPPPQQAYYPPPPPPPPQQQSSGGGFLGLGQGGLFKGGGMLGDAATGAGLGAAGGALAGNAGQGAAIGAIAGTVLGAISRGGQQQQQPSTSDQYAYQQQQYQQQQYQQQQYSQQQADRAYMERREQTESYRRAFSACMASRNYTVQ
ncbi:MAG: hypothetical protein AB7Q97_20720 [Gammaproteobacteria bacterium]